MALKFLNDGYFAGKVGIGIESPSAKLDIKGDTTTWDGMAKIYFTDVSSNSASRNWSVGNGGTDYGALSFIVSNAKDGVPASSTGTAVMSMDGVNKRVGIGTAVPNAKLEINSAITFSTIDTFGQLVVKAASGSTGDLLNIGVDTANSVAFIQANDRGVGTIPLSLQRYGGNVGIGTTSPSAPLEIAGVTNATDTGITIKNGSSTRLRLFHNDSAGASYLTSYRGVDAAQRLIIESGNDLNLSGGGGSAHMVIKTSGNVGIGTTSPKTSLDIVKDSDIWHLMVGGATKKLLVGGQAVNGDVVLQAGAASTVNNAAVTTPYNLCLQRDGGNVGIGTASPFSTAKLQVKTATDKNLAIQTGTTNTTGIKINAFNDAGSANIPLELNGSILSLKTGETEKMRITSAGAISFGSTGTAYGTSGQILKSNGNASPTWIDGSAIPGVPGGSGTLNTIPLWTPDGDTLGNSIITQPSTSIVKVSGNSAYFSIFDTSAAARNIDIGHWVSGQTNIESQGGTLSIGTQSNHNIVFETNGSTKATILSGGNVGIGTTSPDYKLDIEGTSPRIRVKETSSNTSATMVEVENSDGRGAMLGIGGSGRTDIIANRGYINAQSETDGLAIGTEGTDPILFYTQGVAASNERMRIDSTGNVGIGVTGPTEKLVVGGKVIINNTIVPNNLAQLNIGSTGSGETRAIDIDGNWNAGESKSITFTYGTDATDMVGQINCFYNAPGTSIKWGRLYHGGISSVYTMELASTSTTTANLTVAGIVTATDFIGGSGAFLPLAGGTMTGNIDFNDSVRARFGNGNDLNIYHDSTNSYSAVVDVGTGYLLLGTDGPFVLIGNSTATETYIKASNNDSVELYFNNARRLRTTTGGVFVEGEIKIDSALLDLQENTDVDTGTETVASVAIATYTAAFFDFVIKKTTNVRSGTVYACHDGTNVEFTETSTQDLGDTSDVTLSVDISGGNMRLRATTTSDNWSIKSLIRAI